MLDSVFENSLIPPEGIHADATGMAAGGNPRAGRGRITAESFRSLTARLKHQTFTAPQNPEAVSWPEIPDLFAPFPNGAESTVLPPSEATTSAADEAPLPQEEIPAEEPLPLWTEEAGSALDVTVPSFEPLAPFEAAPVVSPEVAPPLQPMEPEFAPAEETAPVAAAEAAFEPLDPDAEPAGVADSAVPELPASHDGTGLAEAVAAPEAAEPVILEEPAPEIAVASPVLLEEEIAIEPEDAVTDVALIAEPVVEQVSDPEPQVAQSEEPSVAVVPIAPVESVAPAVTHGEPEIAETAEVMPAAVEGDEGVIGDPAVILKLLTKAIFSRPTLAERNAFLRDVAATIASEVETGSGEAPPAIATEAPAAAVISPLPDLEPIADSLASRLGPGQTLLRKAEDRNDPFTKPSRDHARPPAERPPGDEEAGVHALSLLDMMTSTSGTAQPQERALAADTLLHLIPRVPAKPLLTIVERLSIMETPPPLVVAKLIRDPRAEIVGPLVERCTAIGDQDLIVAISEGDVAKRRIIARRRHVSAALSDTLIATGDPSVLLTLIRNPNAAFSHEAFHVLADRAAKNQALLAPLTTRNDLPAPVAFELFWHLPSELRRYVLSRFLTDSETLNKILRITRAADDSAETKFPSRDVMERMTDTAIRGQIDTAAKIMAEAGAIDAETALRILGDREGEPLAVALKAMGQQRSKLADILSSLRSPDSGVLRSDRNVAELESIFDTLSFNKARILLTYWDWSVLKKGPYAPHH